VQGKTNLGSFLVSEIGKIPNSTMGQRGRKLRGDGMIKSAKVLGLKSKDGGREKGFCGVKKEIRDAKRVDGSGSLLWTMLRSLALWNGKK